MKARVKNVISLHKLERGKSLDPKLLDLFMDKEDKIYLNYIPEERLSELI